MTDFTPVATDGERKRSILAEWRFSTIFKLVANREIARGVGTGETQTFFNLARGVEQRQGQAANAFELAVQYPAMHHPGTGIKIRYLDLCQRNFLFYFGQRHSIVFGSPIDFGDSRMVGAMLLQ